MAGNIPKLVEKTDNPIQESYRVSKKINPETHSRHIIIKNFKVKKRILKTARVQLLKLKGTHIKLLANISAEILQAIRK